MKRSCQVPWPAFRVFRPWPVACCLLVLVSCIPGVALEPVEQLQFADGLYARGMWETALKEYQAFLAQNPDRKADLPPVYFRMGASLRALGRTNEAAEALQKACDAAPAGEYHDRAGMMLADIRDQAGDPEGQIRILRDLLAGSPSPEVGAACYYTLGMTFEKQGRIRDAMTAYETVLRQYSGTPHVSYAALALAGLDRKNGGGRTDELYRTAAEKAASPRVAAEAWFQLGDFHFARKDYERSADAYGRLVAGYAGDERVAQAQLQRAWALYYAKRFADALDVCAATLSGTGKTRLEKRDEWLYLKANCERQVLRNEAAIATYADLAREYPGSPLAAASAYERALALFKLGHFTEAIAQAKGLMSDDRVRRDVCWLLGESCAALKDDAGAVQYYRMLVDLYPDSALAGDALYRLANLLQKKGDYLQAAQLFGRLAGDFPAHDLASQALFAEAASWGKALKHEQAVAAYARLLAKYPASPYAEDALYLKAMGETYLRRDATARQTWRELATRFPSTKYAADAGFWNGVLLEEGGKLEEAETLFRKALAARPAAGEDLMRRLQFRLALVLQRLGASDSTEGGRVRRDEAANLLQGLLGSPMREKFPPGLLEWLGEVQVARHEWDRASAVADILVSQAPDDHWKQIGWCLKGKALTGQGQAEPAREAFERVLGFSLKSQAMAEAWLKLGELALATDPAKARRAFEEAATLAASDALLPVRVRAYAGLGRALKAQGDLNNAARHFFSVAVLFDDAVLVPECLYEAVAAFSTLGRKEDADKARKELLDRYPESDWAKKVKP